jgi:hypothetical protein
MASNPTGHALWIFGGALGAVLATAGAVVAVTELGDAAQGCARCRIAVIAALAAFALGLWLVRRAFLEMRGSRRP